MKRWESSDPLTLTLVTASILRLLYSTNSSYEEAAIECGNVRDYEVVNGAQNTPVKDLTYLANRTAVMTTVFMARLEPLRAI